jgi:hypothetical protein
MSYLRYLCSFARCGVHHILCCVFCLFFVCLRLLSYAWCCRTHIIVFFCVFSLVLWMVVSNTYCVVFICSVCLRLVYIMLPDSLDCLFVISPLVFSNVYLNRNVSFGPMLSNTVIETLFYITYLTCMV